MIVVSRKLLISDGERNALLYDTRRALAAFGFRISVARGENTGSSMLSNLSRRAPRLMRTLSFRKISSWM